MPRLFRPRVLLAAACAVVACLTVLSASAVFETLTVSTSAIGITPAVRDGAKNCYLSIEGAGIRWRYDGNAPTSSVGHPVASGGQVVLTTRTEMDNFLAIRSGGSDATVQVTCEK